VTDQAVAAGGMRPWDRVFVGGQTGSGKSEFINYLLARVRSQRLLLDTKNEFAIDELEPARDPSAIDWEQPLIHYVPASTDVSEMDELFTALNSRRRVTVFAHEVADLCEYKPGRTPSSISRYISQGRAHGLGLVAGSQRPVEMPKRCITEAEHVLQFVPRLTEADDHKMVAGRMHLTPDELAAELASLQNEYGQYAFLWWDLRARELTRWQPLPDDLRARINVHRTSVV
jgi:hypothetical protein